MLQEAKEIIRQRMERGDFGIHPNFERCLLKRWRAQLKVAIFASVIAILLLRCFLSPQSVLVTEVSSFTRPRSTQATACSPEVDLKDIISLSKSQDKEDYFLVNSYFKGLCGGTYVELGGLDGVRFSNSHLFHHGLDWKGVLIEPNPKSFAALQVNRPNDDTFNFAVCSQSSEVTFVDSGEGAMTGVLEFMAPSFVKSAHPEVENAKQTKIGCEPFSKILERSTLAIKTTTIDFLSLDVEGAEFEVLKTIDFENVEFGVIFYEADDHNPLKNQAMITFLEERGYSFREHTLRSNFHVNTNWHHMYSDFL
jgi:FkbM family methyltransferase